MNLELKNIEILEYVCLLITICLSALRDLWQKPSSASETLSAPVMQQLSKKECLEGRSFTVSRLTPTPKIASPPKNPQRRVESHACRTRREGRIRARAGGSGCIIAGIGRARGRSATPPAALCCIAQISVEARPGCVISRPARGHALRFLGRFLPKLGGLFGRQFFCALADAMQAQIYQATATLT